MNSLPSDASSDQSNCPDGYYRRSNGMVMQIPPEPAKTESPLDLAAIDINSPDELRKLAKRELLYVIQANRGSLGVVSALRELLDRIDGKPAQAVTVDQTVKHITVKATIRFAEMPVRVDNYMQGAVDNMQVIDNEE